ncbi:AAA-domain-containing protein [Ascodesmis nigricans]|uniref:AAA-domain-containing protein n=1 Tax=Ascodesmis nigricans TaxID=341454 RepID=A0A4S2MXH3_9PEZI|nr:AAA-domain-containing protein [Ascodesmis nigricans]
MASRKAHCLLHLPKEGGVYFLDTLAEKLASDAGADLIRLDAQDLAEIGGDYLGDSTQKTPSDISPFELRSLGYDTQAQITETLDDAYAEEEEEAEDMSSEVYEEDEDAYTRGTRPPMVPGVYEAGVSLNTSEIGDAVRRLLGQSVLGAVVLNSSGRGSGMPVDVTNERKMALLLDSMISAGEIKRHKRSPPEETADSIEPPRVGKTLIHVRDYREIERTNSGQVVLKTLHNLVAARRQAGEQILILGTSSAEEEMETYSKTGIRALQTRSDDSFERTIVVPPRLEYLDSIVFEVERDSRVREVNIRHLRDVIRRRSGVECVNLIIPEDWHRGSHDPEVPGIAENIWNFDYVHRIASVALGRLESGTSLTISDVCDAIELIERSDTVKYEWAAKEYQRVKAKEETPDETAKDAAKDKLAKISKTATKHEKGLLSGVIDPASIKSGFSSIRAAPETIDAMKTLTTLSLIRPDAFKYGVLSSDRIPGVLLYGPPGTGKTLLAKAVAKESGATVLEVDGASITDMYVGESEKNVKAIFSLAKKLSPCVIFIDEADAVFGSRHSHTNRSSHRETINQFLKEWADMTSTAFIMVATNRPFDLDDAILRRLPRRILLDLPTPEDRLEILKLHLAEEILDADVDLKDIADNTPLYSGSDCKNLAVGAALNCVRDEIKEFEVSRKYPEKRVIRKKHFDAALKEISPSISDDMGTLTQIRKFDEKYGERAGHKKKVKSWGFELGQGHAQHRTESRVRMD